jgi:hypothetical protein
MTSTASVEFREVMGGGFAPGATDPASGERDGRRAGTYLTLRVTAAIADVPAFVRDPEHTGRLTGSVTFPPIGAEQAPCDGVFKLFTPSGDPAMKLMVYRATFRVGDVEYCLDGAKHVRRRSVMRAWSDTTTLHCRLHEGADATGRVIAAGVLHLGPLAFARQLGSFRTPNATGLSGRVRALAGFLSFFSGEVIDTYVVRRRPQ